MITLGQNFNCTWSHTGCCSGRPTLVSLRFHQPDGAVDTTLPACPFHARQADDEFIDPPAPPQADTQPPPHDDLPSGDPAASTLLLGPGR